MFATVATKRAWRLARTSASGGQDPATSPSATWRTSACPARCTTSRPSHPTPTHRDVREAPLVNEAGRAEHSTRFARRRKRFLFSRSAGQRQISLNSRDRIAILRADFKASTMSPNICQPCRRAEPSARNDAGLAGVKIRMCRDAGLRRWRRRLGILHDLMQLHRRGLREVRAEKLGVPIGQADAAMRF